MRALNLLFAILCLATTAPIAFAQCDDCNCNGRCGYCVDGQCYPRRQTFGYWETNWRRWPVPPPALEIPETPSMGMGLSPFGQDLDLPAAEDEADQTPDLAHRRKRTTKLPAVEPPRDAQEPSPLKADPFQDDNGAAAEPNSSRRPGLHNLGRAPTKTAKGLSGRTENSDLSLAESNPLRAKMSKPMPSTVRASFNQPAPSSAAAPKTRKSSANPLRGR